jgi:hypothetical protein
MINSSVRTYIILILLLGFSCALAGRKDRSVKVLSWTPPITRENSALLQPGDIQLFTVYRNNIPFEHTSGTSIILKAIKGKKSKCYTYVITATDANNLESKFSEEVKDCK